MLLAHSPQKALHFLCHDGEKKISRGFTKGEKMRRNVESSRVRNMSVNWNASVPASNESALFVIYETLIECPRRMHEVNEVTLWQATDTYGKKVPPVRVLSNNKGKTTLNYYLQITSKPVDEISTMSYSGQ